jgi:spore coat protein CotF
MKEKDLMHDLLTSEKQVIGAYSVGMTETSCPNLKNTLMTNYQRVQDLQSKIFNSMENKGWYSTKDAPTNDVQKAKTDANTIQTELK